MLCQKKKQRILYSTYIEYKLNTEFLYKILLWTSQKIQWHKMWKDHYHHMCVSGYCTLQLDKNAHVQSMNQPLAYVQVELDWIHTATDKS